AHQALLSKYDAPPYVSQRSTGAIPFIDFGNKFLVSGASYSPAVLQGKTWSEVAAALSDPASPISQGAVGAANSMTAAICKLTNNQPATACTPAIQKLEGQLGWLRPSRHVRRGRPAGQEPVNRRTRAPG